MDNSDDFIVVVDSCTNPHAKIPNSHIIPKGWGCQYSERNFTIPPRDDAPSNFVTPNGVVSQLMTHCLQSNRGSFNSLKVGYLDVCDIVVHGKAHNVCQIIESVIDDTGTRTMRYNETCDTVIGNESFLMGVQNFNTSGTQLAYHNLNGALRAGNVSGTQWNLSLLGDNSVAFGNSNTALGSESFSHGSNNLVNGTNNIVFGSGNLLFDNYSATTSPAAPTNRTQNSIILNGTGNDIAADGVISGSSIAINSVIGGTNNQLVISNCTTTLANNTLGQAQDCLIFGGTGSTSGNVAGIGIGANTFTNTVTQSNITGPVTNSILLFDGHPSTYPTLHEINTLKEVFKRGFIRAGGTTLNGYGDDGARERMIPFEAIVAANSQSTPVSISITQNTILSCNGVMMVAGYNSGGGPPSIESTLATVSQFIVLRTTVGSSTVLHDPVITQIYTSAGFSDVLNITVDTTNLASLGTIAVNYNNTNSFPVKVHAIFYAYDMIMADQIP